LLFAIWQNEANIREQLQSFGRSPRASLWPATGLFEAMMSDDEIAKGGKIATAVRRHQAPAGIA
jgi:hypothetical protein